ncbi:hypothetical protein LV483_34805 [Pendulispora rubella]
MDVSDLLRAQIVLAISAFDTLVHELTRLGMLEAAAGKRTVVDTFQRFQVSFESVQLSAGASTLDWLDAEIRRKHSFLSFQTPDKVADAIRLISSVSLWNSVGSHLGKSPTDIKKELQLIVDRRNKIAHEADGDPSFPGTRWPIDPIMVNRAIDFLEAVGKAIFLSV